MIISKRAARYSAYTPLASSPPAHLLGGFLPVSSRVSRIFSMFFLLALPLFSLTRVPTPAYAVTSNTVNFQARLQTGGGAIAPDGYYNVRFNLYAASTGGTSLWTETRDYNSGSPDNRVRVANGYLTVSLGDVTGFPSTIPWDQQLYLTMNIGGTGTTSSWDGEMSPRLTLTAVPYAFNAKTASQLINTASGISSTLTLQAPTVGDQNFIIPDQGAAGTYTLLTGAAASGSYIQLQGSSPGSQQTGNFNISGTGTAAAGLKTPTISLGTSGSATGAIELFNASNTNKVTITTEAQTAGNLALTIPNAGSVSDTVCLLTLANCLGSGGGSGAANTSLSNLYETNINTALNTTSGDLTLQTTTSGNLVLNPAGSINLNQNTTLAAGKTITITGSTTANRPASPTEGMLYYDTSTHQLLQYNGTKWVSDRSTATKIVAASDSTQTAKDSADYVTTGTNDQTIIANAVTALPTSGGTVYLLPGTYNFGASLDITKDNVTLAGDGVASATINRAFDGTALADGGIIKVDADSVTITNITLNGNSATYGNSYDNGIYKSASYGGLNINHVKLIGNKGSAIYLDGDTNNYNTDSVVADNTITTSYAGGLYIDQGFDIQVSDNNISLPGGDAISIASSDRITINGNTIKNAVNGIIIVDSSHINVNANTVYYNSDKGINLYGGNESITISANTVASNLVGIGLSGSSSHTNTNVTISGNTITNNGYEGVLVNDAVRANITGNVLNDNTGTSDHSSIRVNGSVDSSITSNIITDTAGTGYAILLEWYNAVNTYLSNNTFSGTGAESISSISNTTIFANQMTTSTGDFTTKNLTNSTTALQIQNASGSNVMAVDTTNNQVVVGNTTTAGKISLSDGSSHAITIATGTQSGSYTLSLPTLTSNDTICLQSAGNCSGAGSSVTSIGVLDGGTANANGASISSNTLYLQSASAGYAGLVNTTTQYFAGNKRFTGSISIYDTSTLAFQIINSDSEKTLGFDNTNAILALGTVNPSGESAAYSGTLQFASGAYNAYTVSIAPVAGSLTASRTITLPNASGTVCLDSGNCVASLSGSFIVNSTSLQTANFNISGTGKAVNLQATSAMTVGTTTGTGSFTNNGATINTTLALGNFAGGGAIGTAANTVDKYTSISVAQTAASQTLTVPSPTAATTYGRMLYLSNIGTASFTLLGTPLKPGATATLVWSNTNGGASWQYAGSDGNSILNQTSSTQTAGFTINGTGTAGTFIGTTALQAPLLDTASGITLNIATTNATGVNIATNATAHAIAIGTGAAVQAITVGSLTSTSVTTIQAGTGTATGDLNLLAAAGGIINVGNNAVTNKVINVGSAGNTAAASTVNIATTSANYTQSVNVGSTGSANNVVLIQGGTSSTAIRLAAGASGTITVGSQTAANTVNIGTVGSAAFSSTVNIATSTGAAQTVTINSTSNASNAVSINGGSGSAAVSIQAAATGTITIGTTNTNTISIGNSSGTTSINLNQNTTLAAGKTITITGSTTANRPASPSEGMMYYDTTTKQLLTYSNGKWQGDRSMATKIVAASNSSQAERDGADYVATGSSDETVINAALTAAAGGKVYLTEGTYIISASISVPSNTTLAGAGSGTIVTVPNAQNGSYSMIANGSTGSPITIRDLALDGNKANQSSGHMIGIYMSSVSSSMVANVTVRNMYGPVSTGWNGTTSSAGIYVGSSSYVTVTNSIVTGNSDYGIVTLGALRASITNNTITSNGNSGLLMNINSSVGTITGNIITGGVIGMEMNGSSSNTITGNTISTSSKYGLSLASNANTNVIYANSFSNVGGSTDNNSIFLIGSDNNNITNNTFSDISANTTNYAINISDSSSNANYLADNTFSSNPGTSTINDLGTGTVYASQPTVENGGSLVNRTADSTTAFQVQNASGVALLTADTTNSKIVVTNLSVTGSISLPHGADFSTVGSSNNVDFGTGSLFRLTGASAQIITGIAGGTDGRQITLMNTASQAATLANNSGSSSAANMIITGTGSDLSIAVGASVTLVYDSISAVWRVVGTISGTTSGGSYVSLQTGTLVADTGSLSLSGSGNAASFIATTSIQAPLLDAASSTTLGIGTTNASFIMIGQWGVDTSINGQLSVAGYIQTGSGKIDTTNSSTNLLIGTDNAASIQLGQWNVPTTVSGQLTVNGGSLTLGTTFAGTTFITPEGSSVSTRINIPVYDVPNFGQVLAFGVSSGSSTSSRALSIFDARTSAHQPSIAIFNPAETDAIGFSWDGSDSVALLKTLGADVGISINGSTSASFTASQVNINQNTAIASGKTLSVAGNTTISTTSTAAFKIQNTSSVALFNADTSTATITMGTGGNTVTFTGTGGLVATGTARHTKSIVLSPEYAGAVLDAQSDSACASAANGTMTAGYDSVNRTNYYNWTSTQTTNQCYDVVVQVPVPADFSGWYGGSIMAKTSSTSNSSYGIAMVDSTGTYDANYGSSYASPGTLSTSWSNVATSTLSGTYTAGDYATIKIRMSAKNNADIQLGNITLYYYSSF